MLHSIPASKITGKGCAMYIKNSIFPHCKIIDELSIRQMGFQKANSADRWLYRSIQVSCPSRVSGAKVAGWDLCVSGELWIVDVGESGLFKLVS